MAHLHWVFSHNQRIKEKSKNLWLWLYCCISHNIYLDSRLTPMWQKIAAAAGPITTFLSHTNNIFFIVTTISEKTYYFRYHITLRPRAKSVPCLLLVTGQVRWWQVGSHGSNRSAVFGSRVQELFTHCLLLLATRPSRPRHGAEKTCSSCMKIWPGVLELCEYNL